MKNFDSEIASYDPREHQPDSRQICSGYAILVLVVMGLFLF